MTMELTDVKRQVLELPRKDQLSLGAFINEITRPIPVELDEEMMKIIAIRAARLRSGETKGVPLEEVMAEYHRVEPFSGES
jgi:hypothetical protein